jgi:hypothetical protein
MVDQPPFRRESVAAPVYISWGAVIAGAIAAAALTFVLITFGAAIGLAVASPSATWRDTSVALGLLSGLWLLLTAIASFAVGGYLAGRLRATGESTTVEEVEFRDGIHGILVWGLAIIIGAALALSAARATSPQAIGNALVPTAATAEPLLAFELDRLFRTDRRPGDAVEPDMRAQAARIITTSLGHADIAAEDRAYLVRMVMTRTGLAQPDAERRVTDVISQARGSIRRARANVVILAFMTAASLLAGAAVAWFVAGLGGRQRDGEAIAAFWLNRPNIR